MELVLFIALVIFYVCVSLSIYISEIKEKNYEEDILHEEEQKEFSGQKEEAEKFSS